MPKVDYRQIISNIYHLNKKKQVKFYSKKRTYSFKIIGCVFWSRYLNEYLFSIKKFDIV